jgi:CDP-glucose 4,6-dehydratase
MDSQQRRNLKAIETAFLGKRVVITGHTGFKGAWLSLWLSQLGAQVSGYGLHNAQSDGIYASIKGASLVEDRHGDIRVLDHIQTFMSEMQPDFVFHMAAQPLVRLSYQDPLGTISTNVIGSANVLESVRTLPNCCHTIFVTSDKCYQNREWCFSYRENDPLGGKDPYSMSKAAAELVAESYRRSYFDNNQYGSRVVSVRAGNVIGGGDYSADRLVPDCVRAALAKKPLIIRSPNATRPWQHVLDCVYGYLVAAAAAPGLPPSLDSESFNFGPLDPHANPVSKVTEMFFEYWREDTPGVVFEPAEKSMAEAGYLAVSIEKAQRLLGWQPVWTFSEAMKRTVEWYEQKHIHQADMLSYSKKQIQQFIQSAQGA